MAIDFSQVKTITIPEGSVKKITDSTGVVLWKAQTEGWHTLWEGSKEVSDSVAVDVATLSSLSGTVTLRVTWSCSMSGGSSMTNSYYNNNGSTTTSTKPSSPFQFNLDTGSNRFYIVGCQRKNSWSAGRGAYLEWVASYKKFKLQGSESVHGTGGVSLSMTITKIEQYY